MVQILSSCFFWCKFWGDCPLNRKSREIVTDSHASCPSYIRYFQTWRILNSTFECLQIPLNVRAESNWRCAIISINTIQAVIITSHYVQKMIFQDMCLLWDRTYQLVSMTIVSVTHENNLIVCLLHIFVPLFWYNSVLFFWHKCSMSCKSTQVPQIFKCTVTCKCPAVLWCFSAICFKCARPVWFQTPHG